MSEQDYTLLTGEALVGDGPEIAHVDVEIGLKGGPVGYAFANGLAQPAEGHTTLLAVATPNSLTKPATLLVNKVTIKGAKAAVQHFGPAQEAIAKAVLRAVEEGIIPSDQVDKLVIIVSVFIHWEAGSNERIAAFNHQATYLAICNAMKGTPTSTEAIQTAKTSKHPFGSGDKEWKQDAYDTALASVQQAS